MPTNSKPKTYQERKATRVAKTAATLAIVEDCDFETDAFFQFRHGNTAQAATRVTSRTDPKFRFLVLHLWSDSASDPQQSTCRAICPPGREGKAALVCEAVRVFWARRCTEQSNRSEEELRHKEAAQ